MKNDTALQLASADPLGSVLLADDCVYRILSTNEHSHVCRTIEILANGLPGAYFPATEICNDEAIHHALNISAKQFLLRHQRLPISYPHEWCAAMLKRAACFHLELSVELLKHELYLKDAHPWNILFDGSQPYFVDFTSVVDRDLLFGEDFLQTNRIYRDEDEVTRVALVTEEIFRTMFEPYFFVPLCVYAYVEEAQASSMLFEMALNATEKGTPQFEQFVRVVKDETEVDERVATATRLKKTLEQHYMALRSEGNLLRFFRSVRDVIAEIDCTATARGYQSYYLDKGENQAYNAEHTWNEKQHGVKAALDCAAIHTVLDVGANVGWYTKLSTLLGKEAVTFDVDEECIEFLYQDVQRENLPILPLRLNFTDLANSRTSRFDNLPLLLDAYQRFCSDAVLALALMHHLVLGVGLSLDEVFMSLRKLARKRLVLEFVDLSDLLIQNNKDYFPTYFRSPELFTSYSLESAQQGALQYFTSVRLAPSTSASRTLLVCDTENI